VQLAEVHLDIHPSFSGYRLRRFYDPLYFLPYVYTELRCPVFLKAVPVDTASE